jgi:predicted Zn-dependent protease
MVNNLPSDLQKLRAFLPELIETTRKRAPCTCALVTQSGGALVAKSRSDERVNPILPRRGIRISIWDGATFHSVATSNINDQAYLIRLTRELVDSITIKSDRVPEIGPSLDKHFESTYLEDPTKISNRERQEHVTHIYDFCKQYDKRIAEANVTNEFNQEYRLFCNSARLLSSVITRTNIFVLLFAIVGSKQIINYQ